MTSAIVQVHHRGDRGVDGILRLIELAGHDGPLEAMLCAMCDEIAAIAGVDVASIYVRERGGDDRLVMRGNIGFAMRAIGATALRVGEGITGLVAECMRPISAAHAAQELAYKHVPGLGEERYPVFVGVPLIAGGTAIGVLVLQRRQTAFELREVTLAMALAAPVTLAVERRRALAQRSARLTGVALVAGSALGRTALIPTLASDLTVDRDTLERGYRRLRDDLGRAIKRLSEDATPASGAALDRLALALCDARLRDRIETCAGEPGGLRSVAREYARASLQLRAFGPGHVDRSSEIAELCALLSDARTIHPDAIWIGDRIDSVMAVVAVARGAAALVACDCVTPAAIAIARAAGLPVVSDVTSLFDWARAADVVVVDGDSGLVLVHPAPSDIERLRRARR